MQILRARRTLTGVTIVVASLVAAVDLLVRVAVDVADVDRADDQYGGTPMYRDPA